MPPIITDDPRSTFRLRFAEKRDGPALVDLATSNGLDENSPYAYLMWAEYFGDTTVVATEADDDQPIGFVIAFRRPDEFDTIFVWQVGVSNDHRRRGIAGRMLDHLVAHTGATRLEATVTPTNEASATLFNRFGARHGTAVRTDELFAAALFPAGHEAEIRFRIGPIDTGPRSAPTPRRPPPARL